ncbi:MAG: hypothetical protein ACLQVD_12175 [Capsulimonadaceae bacterium]
MPVPYRRTPRAAEVGLAAYLDILWIDIDHSFYGGLLVIDGKGQPQEFVHNAVAAPAQPEATPVSSPKGRQSHLAAADLLWPEDLVRRTGIPLLAHSLFDACRREPDLLVCLSTLGTPEFCTSEIAPAVPFAQAVPEREGMPAEWSWINSPPSSGMRAALLARELVRRGFIVEPFERLRDALRLVFPQAAWDSATRLWLATT